MNTRNRDNVTRVSSTELRRRLENRRQPGLKSKLDERRQAEALWGMISQLRTTTAA